MKLLGRCRHVYYVLMCSLLTSLGCAPRAPRPTVTPMIKLEFPDPQGPSGRLIVMLPGVLDAPQSFVDNGFISSLHERGLRGDVSVVDAHFGYYEDRSIAQRLRADIIGPARTAGYREIWLVGTSLGGFGSLVYAQEQPGEITGLFLIAPYPGSRDITKAIRAAGGPLSWLNTADAQGPDERLQWRWLAEQARSQAVSPAIYFATGEADRFVQDQRMLAELLPTAHRDFIPGGHTWPVWRQSWERFLTRGLFKQVAQTGPAQ